MQRPTSGLILLGVGASIECIGLAIQAWQEQNVTTISSSITLPTALAMLLAIVLISRGYGRAIRTAPTTGATLVVGVGSFVGVVLWGTALWWQLKVGLPSGGNSDLYSYSAGVVLFVGVALLARGVTDLAGGFSRQTVTDAGGPSEGSSVGPVALRSPYHRVVLASGFVAVGMVFLAVTAGLAGWVNQQASNVNGAYLVISPELGITGSWFLLVGYAGTLRNLVRRPLRAVAFLGAFGGGALVIGGCLWWATALRTVDSSTIAAASLLVAGVGVLLLSIRPFMDALGRPPTGIRAVP